MSDSLATEFCDAVEMVDVDIRQWVESARQDQTLYRNRQTTEIVLAAIGLAPSLHDTLVLKGGTLMALAFRSERVTGDVDFSANAGPENFAEMLTAELNRVLTTTAIRLGYLDIVCRVQGVVKRPRPLNFADYDFPALEVRVASALRGTPQEQALKEGRAARILKVEISFRDQVYAFQELNLMRAGASVRAFTIHEIIAEKLRALLQQPIRNRNRRQDVYDIALLLDEHPIMDEDRRIIFTTFIEKCRTRGISPDSTSLDDSEVVRRAEVDWETLRLEVTNLPAFYDRFAVVRAFYSSLPW